MNSFFSHISQTGILSPGYTALLLSPEVSDTANIPRFEIDLHHSIFDKAAFQVLLKSKSLLQTVCLLLRLCSMSKTEPVDGGFTVSWLTQQKNMVELGLKQLDIIQNIKKKIASFAAAADKAAAVAIAEAANNTAVVVSSKSKKRKLAGGEDGNDCYFLFHVLNFFY